MVHTAGANVDVNALAASPHGGWLAASTSAGVQLLRTEGGAQAVALDAPAGSSLCWRADGKRLATAHENTILLWDPDDSRQPVRKLEGKPAGSLAWSLDGKRLAAAGDGKVTVWDAASGAPIAAFEYVAGPHQPRFAFGGKFFTYSILAWCDGGRRLAVAGEDENIRVWDVDAQKVLTTLRGHDANEAHENHNVVCSLAASPDGRRLAAASPDGTFVVWDTTHWKEVLTLRPAVTGPAVGPISVPNAGPLAWSPDGWQLGFFGPGGAVTIWDATPEENRAER